VVVEAKKLSFPDTLRVLLFVSVSMYLKGLVAPRGRFAGLLAWLNAEQWSRRTVGALHDKYRCDYLWGRFPLVTRTLLVLNQEGIDAVLRSGQYHADPPIKKGPLSEFAPDSVIVSSGAEWEDRREFNEEVLQFRSPRRFREAFLGVAAREADALVAASDGTVTWHDFERLGRNISQKVVHGADQINTQLADNLASMAARSNCYPLPRDEARFAALYREIDRYLAGHLAAVRGLEKIREWRH
jgi:cytochrome P450